MIQPTFNYVGVRSGILYYREKDGNLRPKTFEEFRTLTCSSMDDFKKNLAKTNEVRNKKIAIKKLDEIMKGLADMQICDRVEMATKLKCYISNLEQVSVA